MERVNKLLKVMMKRRTVIILNLMKIAWKINRKWNNNRCKSNKNLNLH